MPPVLLHNEARKNARSNHVIKDNEATQKYHYSLFRLTALVTESVVFELGARLLQVQLFAHIIFLPLVNIRIHVNRRKRFGETSAQIKLTFHTVAKGACASPTSQPALTMVYKVRFIAVGVAH